MLRLLRLFLGLLPRSLRYRKNLLLENLALRQQLAVLKAKHPGPKVQIADRAFWVVLRRFWPDWKRALMLVSARDGHWMAQGRIQTLLESTFTEATSSRQKAD